MKVYSENEVLELQIKAFVDGAKWWEHKTTSATMWQSDQNDAAIIAAEKYSRKEVRDASN